MRRSFLGCLLLFAVCAAAHSQNLTTVPCNDKDSGGGWFHQDHACELRRVSLPLSNGHLSVSGRNGGIEVIGEDRSDVALEARVTAQASSEEEARATVREVRIVTGGEIRAEGPNQVSLSHRSWSVDFRLRVPRHLVAADLHTQNGGITLANLNGVIHAGTTNGGLTLSDLSGDVHVETVNGGVQVRLAGNRWQGAGLSARSTNGGISVSTSGHYAAHVVAQTVNGGISVSGAEPEGQRHNHLDTDIGGGGPTLHLETVNGGVALHTS